MLQPGLAGTGRVGTAGMVVRRYGYNVVCNDYKLLVPGNSNGVTTLRMNSFPEVLELK